MFATSLKCRCCGKEYPLTDLYLCPNCGGLIEVQYSESDLLCKENVLSPDRTFSGMWQYRKMLPVHSDQNIVSLGEGDTPLLSLKHSETVYDMDCALFAKAELLNPSGSFKDRPSSVGISVAKEHGCKAVLVASTGNAAAAVSCYAARAGMKCIVLIPAGTDPGKVSQALAYGAVIFEVPGNFSDAFNISKQISSELGIPNVTSTFYNPYTVEGDKTIAYELFKQLGRTPDYIAIPIGTGPLLVGIYKGYRELMRMGLINRLPKMIGVQSEQCMPIVTAFEGNSDHVNYWKEDVHTAAGGIADTLFGYEQDGELTLQTVRSSGGSMISVSEQQLLNATDILGQKEGLYCEPTGAVTLAGVKKLYDMGRIQKGASVILLLTGHGFKYTGRKQGSIFPYQGITTVKNLLN